MRTNDQIKQYKEGQVVIIVNIMKSNNVFHKTADFLTDYCWEALACTPPIGFTVWGLMYTRMSPLWCWIIFVVLFVLNIYFCIQIGKKSKSITKITKDNEEKAQKIQEMEASIEKFGVENFYLFRYILSYLYKNLNLDNTSRISVYKKKGERFIIMGRYSANPELDKLYRRHYPIAEGFIGKAYRDGEYYIADLPKYKPSNADNYYTSVMAKCDIPKDTLKSVSMKSRTYYCKSLTDKFAVDRKAVIVIESTEANKFRKEDIEAGLKDEMTRLNYFIENFKFVVPEVNVDFAKEEGF